MKRYNITVNGKTYDVAVDEIAAGAQAPVITPVAAAAPVAAPAAAPAPAQAAVPVAAPAPVVEGGTEVTAPMPGNILDVKVKVGDTVENGTPIVVLEAMKMENDVVATVGGKVVSINVKKGDAVESGAVIAIIQ